VRFASFWFSERKYESIMKALKTHVAGVDVHKEILAITVLVGAPDEEPVAQHFECSTFTQDLMGSRRESGGKFRRFSGMGAA